jgi:hypothetical protein
MILGKLTIQVKFQLQIPRPDFALFEDIDIGILHVLLQHVWLPIENRISINDARGSHEHPSLHETCPRFNHM